MPNAASVSGTKSVRVIDVYAVGKPVQRTTKIKMSQTWLASHTGAIEWSITLRGGHRARPACDEVPDPGAEVGPCEHGVREHPDEQHDSDGGAHVTPAATGLDRRAVGHVVVLISIRVLGVDLAVAAAHRAQHVDRGDPQRERRGARPRRT